MTARKREIELRLWHSSNPKEPMGQPMEQPMGAAYGAAYGGSLWGSLWGKDVQGKDVRG
jgi:hypothetical protein